MPDVLKDLLRHARWRARAWAGRDVYVRPQHRLPSVLLGGRPGEGYGGWRTAAAGLGPESVVYSAGIGDDISFDRDLIRRFGVTVHAFDPTPEALAWLARQDVPASFVAHPVGLAAYDGTAAFFPHANPDWVSHSMHRSGHTTDEAVEVPVRRLETLMRERGHTHLDLLKLDIEGAEYAVLDDLLASGLDVRQLLVEFHDRDETTRLRALLKRLFDAGFRVFAVSPRGEEYSFVRV